MIKTRVLPAIAAVTVVLLPGAAEAQDLTVAAMQACRASLQPDPDHWGNFIGETPTLVCGGHDYSNGTEANRVLEFKSKQTGVQLKLSQQMFSYNVAAYTEQPLTEYKIDRTNGTMTVMRRTPGGRRTSMTAAQLPPAVRAALPQGLLMMRQLRQSERWIPR